MHIYPLNISDGKSKTPYPLLPPPTPRLDQQVPCTQCDCELYEQLQLSHIDYFNTSYRLIPMRQIKMKA